MKNLVLSFPLYLFHPEGEPRPFRMRGRALYLILWFSFGFPSFSAAQVPVDENALFSDSQTVVEAPAPSVGKSVPEKKKNSLGMSGQVLSTNRVDHNTSASPNDHVFSESTLTGNLYFDARYGTDNKFFADLETYDVHPWNDDAPDLNPDQTDRPHTRLTEIFLDTPIEKTVYLRWGKQVLQWGRCRLWNPTDLINIDKNTFIQRTTSREGVYGLKLHVPSGTRFNYYAFVDTGKELDIEKTAGAFKFEFLMDKTEMAFSIWDKKGFLPVYGYDFSTRLMTLDVAGEACASKGFLRNTLQENDGVLSKGGVKDEWRSRASVDVGRGFNLHGQPDKIQITGEAFYNGTGYTENIFNDQNNYAYAQPITLSDGTVMTGGSKSIFFLSNNLYEVNYYGRYYLALFTSVNKFFTSSLTLNNNLIRNVSDGSSVYSTGLNYQNIHNWQVDFTVYFFTGPKNREYTVSQTQTSYQLAVSWRF